MRQLLSSILFTALVMLNTSAAYADFDAGKAAPQVHELKMWYPAVAGETLRNYQNGGFTSTVGPTDPARSLVNQGKGLNIRFVAGAHGQVLVSNCSFKNIATNIVPQRSTDGKLMSDPTSNHVWDGKPYGKPHTDGIFVTGSADTADVQLVIEDVLIDAIDGEGIHVDDGAWDEITVRRSSVSSADGGRITIKLHSGWPIKRLNILDTTAAVYIDASHVDRATIPQLLPAVTIGGLRGNVLVTVLDGTTYHSVPANQVGLKVNGSVPQQPEAQPALPPIPPTITGIGVYFTDGHVEFHPSDGSATAGTLKGFWASDAHFATAAAPQSADPRDAVIDAQAAKLAEFFRWKLAAPSN